MSDTCRYLFCEELPNAWVTELFKKLFKNKNSEASVYIEHVASGTVHGKRNAAFQWSRQATNSSQEIGKEVLAKAANPDRKQRSWKPNHMNVCAVASVYTYIYIYIANIYYYIYNMYIVYPYMYNNFTTKCLSNSRQWRCWVFVLHWPQGCNLITPKRPDVKKGARQQRKLIINFTVWGRNRQILPLLFFNPRNATKCWVLTSYPWAIWAL